MNHLYHIFLALIMCASCATQARLRHIKSYKEFETHVLKPNRGSVVHVSIDDIDPRTNFSGALPTFEAISNEPGLTGIAFFSANINNTPEVLIWLSQKGHHISEWPAFVFIENGEVKSIETRIHGDSLPENIRSGVRKHLSRKPIPANTASQSAPHMKHRSIKRKRRGRRATNGRSHMPCK